MIEIFDCDQGSPEWFAARSGIPTASEFEAVLTPGKGKAASKTRRTYLLKLAGEVLTGELMEQATSKSLERGKAYEGEARDMYSLVANVDVQSVGFIRNGKAGCSPDALIGHDGGLEIKIALPHIQIERLIADELPEEHQAQVQGNIWIADRQWWDFISYCPKLPPFVKRVRRDDGYIANLAGAVDAFNTELAETVERIRRYGVAEKAAA